VSEVNAYVSAPKLPSFTEQIDKFYQFLFESGKPASSPRSLSPNQKLELLQIFADLIVESTSSPSIERRKHRQSVSRFPLNSLCFVCKEIAFVRHHIIQLQNGGVTRRKNIIPLCNYCHSRIHPWLREKKEYKRPRIDWNLPDSQHFKPYVPNPRFTKFYDWLVPLAQNPLSLHRHTARAIVKDPKFPRYTNRLWRILRYCKKDSNLYENIRRAHADWRKFCVNEHVDKIEIVSS
jgi:hypothetical protein